MTDLIDELLDTLDLIDDRSKVIAITKNLILASLGAGEIGDRYPITAEDVKKWRKIRGDYHEAMRLNHVQLASALSDLLSIRTIDLIFRSFTSKNSGLLFHMLSERWKTSDSDC